MTQRQSDFVIWLSNPEYAGKLYERQTIKAYASWLNSRVVSNFEIPNVQNVYDILDIEELESLSLKYMSGDLNKNQKDLRSAFRKYIEFCQTNQNQFDDNNNIEDNPDIISRTEGGKKVIISVRSERNKDLRDAAIKLHKLTCQVCEFNFGDVYGELGEDFIEVHHIKPLSKNITSVVTSVETDLNVVCSNCHRMLHHKKGITLTIEELKAKLKRNKC